MKFKKGDWYKIEGFKSDFYVNNWDNESVYFGSDLFLFDDTVTFSYDLLAWHYTKGEVKYLGHGKENKIAKYTPGFIRSVFMCKYRKPK